jgi:drug/metabolite transporter (DMT)-like permease
MPQLALLLTTVIWAATFPATKLALDEILPLSFLFFRFLVSTLAMASILVALRRPLGWDPPQLRMAGIAAVLLLIGYVAQTVGLRYTTASNYAFITALYVVFVPLFLRRFNTRLWVALLLAVTGLWFLVRPSGFMGRGDVYTVLCAIAFAGHIIALELFSRRSTVESLASWQLILVTGALLPAAAVEGLRFDVQLLTPVILSALFVTGVLATGIAFFIQVWAQRYVPAQRVALIFALEPALSAWMSWVVLGEKMDAGGWIGSGLILAGVLAGTTASVPHPHDPLQP